MPAVTVQRLTDLVESNQLRFSMIEDITEFLGDIEAFLDSVVSGALYHCKLALVGKLSICLSHACCLSSWQVSWSI